MKIPNKKSLQILLAGVLFLLFFVSFLNIRLWDFDFWWHIATGRYIAQEHQIPEKDIFSYVTEENRERYTSTALRERFLMKQYWLAQVFFYQIYSYFGSWGIVVLRSLLLTLCVVLVFYGLRMYKVPFSLALCLLLPVFYVLLRKFTGERPVLFTFVMAPLVFLLIEHFLLFRKKSIFLLPLLMALWANLHGGFILGIVFIAVFLLLESLKYVRQKSDLSRQEYLIFLAVMGLSIFATLLNPNYWDVFRLQFGGSKYEIFFEGVQEYQPLWEFYFSKAANIDYSVLFIVIFAVAVLLIRFRWMKLSHLVILAGLFSMSLLQQRYFAFTTTVGMIIIGAQISDILRHFRRHDFFNSTKFKILTMAASIILLLTFSWHAASAFLAEVPHYSKKHEVQNAVRPVEFIIRNKIPGRIFNSDLIGGYVSWRLYPSKQVFTDTRAIDIASAVEYSNIIAANPAQARKGGKPLWERLLNMYGVNIILVHPLDYYGAMNPLMTALLENNRWVLIYTDGNYLIFIKNSEENRDLIAQHGLRTEDAYWSIVYKASILSLANNSNSPFLFDTLGQCFMKLKNYEEAEKAYRHVLRINPDHESARANLHEIAKVKAAADKKTEKAS